MSSATEYNHLPPLCPQHTLFHTNILLNPVYTLIQIIELVNNFFKTYSADIIKRLSWDAWTHSWSGMYYPDANASCDDEELYPPYTCFSIKIYRCRENHAQFMVEWQRFHGDRFMFRDIYSHFVEYITAATTTEEYTTYVRKPPEFGENIEKTF